eukprot:TRINITY_DN13622_c0_g1_i1.p1 TRINITY_DN13622_c0_g1~~TRINITY_DN13622_c0_g1_i1.p1  ORF type:complete len:788 (+),score=149.35 TRINITY_DN13622_c0_g1_i1:93-2456(+)
MAMAMFYMVMTLLALGAVGDCPSDGQKLLQRRASSDVASHVLESSMLSIEQRVINGRTRQQHRQRVAEGLRRDGIDSLLVERLSSHMEESRLTLWDPEDPLRIAGKYVVAFVDNCTLDGSTRGHLRKVAEAIASNSSNQDYPNYTGKVNQVLSELNELTVELSFEALADVMSDDCVSSVEQDYTIVIPPDEMEPAEPIDLMDTRQKPKRGRKKPKPGKGEEEEEDKLPWGLDQIDGSMDDEYQYANTGEGVYIYIVDTGVQAEHIEFDNGARAVAGADFVDIEGDALGNSCGKKGGTSCNSPGEEGCSCGLIPKNNAFCSGHGTHCAGTAAGTNVGVAKGATVVAVRVLGCDGRGSTSGVLGGMDYVIHMKKTAHPDTPTVMSMSLGGPRGPESFHDPSKDPKTLAVAAAKEAGVAVVVAAGNSGVDADTRSPAHIDDAITVCASNSDKQRAWFSCFGPGVDICAPGHKVNSAITGPEDAYKEYSGTSMAAPHVAGVLALMLQHNPTWTVEEQTNELLTDCVESSTVDMLIDSNKESMCKATEIDDRCKYKGECHNCTNAGKCAAKGHYVEGSGTNTVQPACGAYVPTDPTQQCVEKCSEVDDGQGYGGTKTVCRYGTCMCDCGGFKCDATYLWGFWLDFCCKTYFADCDSDVVEATPNKLTNLYKSGKCAAVQASQSGPAPPPSPMPEAFFPPPSPPTTSVPPGVCRDNPHWKDPEFGDGCGTWAGYSCDIWEFADDLKANCPETCGLCGDGNATTTGSAETTTAKPKRRRGGGKGKGQAFAFRKR